jgi:hypothetical protein
MARFPGGGKQISQEPVGLSNREFDWVGVGAEEVPRYRFRFGPPYVLQFAVRFGAQSELQNYVP